MKSKKDGRYSEETLHKYIELVKACIATFMLLPVNLIKMCISKGNRKIGRVMNVSLPAIITCKKNCQHCKKFCYDIKACLQYAKTVIPARVRNYVILIKDRNEYFNRIDKACEKRRTNKYFRWHVSGDIIDYDYFDRMVKLAKKYPAFKFWTYTKQYYIVNAWILCNGGTKAALPENLTIMFSEWRGIEMVNPYGLPEFRIVFKSDKVKPKGYYCPGNCDICKKINRGCIAGETTYANEH